MESALFPDQAQEPLLDRVDSVEWGTDPFAGFIKELHDLEAQGGEEAAEINEADVPKFRQLIRDKPAGAHTLTGAQHPAHKKVEVHSMAMMIPRDPHAAAAQMCCNTWRRRGWSSWANSTCRQVPPQRCTASCTAAHVGLRTCRPCTCCTAAAGGDQIP
jgi:hypothetical protein